MRDEQRRAYARIVAVAAGAVWLTLLVIGFGNRDPSMTYSRWGALLVLIIAWSYASSKPKS